MSNTQDKKTPKGHLRTTLESTDASTSVKVKTCQATDTLDTWLIQVNQVRAKYQHESLESFKEPLQAGGSDCPGELQSHTVTLHSCRPSHKHRAAAVERNPARWMSLTDRHRCVSVCVCVCRWGVEGGRALQFRCSPLKSDNVGKVPRDSGPHRH